MALSLVTPRSFAVSSLFRQPVSFPARLSSATGLLIRSGVEFAACDKKRQRPHAGAPSFSVMVLDQNTIFRANCQERGVSCPVMVPHEALVGSVFGSYRFG